MKKSTGIVRRIDDLGRIVIPKEIRRTMKIREGDPLELFMCDDGILFQKYRPLDEFAWRKLKDYLRGIIVQYVVWDRFTDEVIACGDKFNIEDADSRKIYVAGDQVATLVW